VHWSATLTPDSQRCRCDDWDSHSSERARRQEAGSQRVVGPRRTWKKALTPCASATLATLRRRAAFKWCHDRRRKSGPTCGPVRPRRSNVSSTTVW